MKRLSDDQKKDLGNIIVSAAVAGIGFSISGPLGVEIIKNIGINLASNKVQNFFVKLREHWLSKDGTQNSDIQQALSCATIEALEDLEKIYIQRVNDDKESIQKNFEDLNKYVKEEFLVLVQEEVNEKDVKQYLSESTEKATKQIVERISYTSFLGNHTESFSDFFTKYYFSYLQLRFYELLNKDEEEYNRSWRVFQRLLLEGIMEDLQNVRADQTIILDGQESIQNSLKKLDEIRGILKHPTDPRMQNEPFENVLKNTIRESQESIQNALEKIANDTASTREDVEAIRANVEANFYFLDKAISRFCDLCTQYRRKDKKVLIVGDVMLDHKMVGSSAKYSNVQKHQIVKKGEGEVYMVYRDLKTLGGAADVAMAFSLISSVTLIGIIGSDSEGKALLNLCQGHITFDPIEAPEVITTKKIYLHRSTEGPDLQVIRFDREDSESMTNYCQRKNVQETIINKINAIDNLDCIVIKDHQKGMISKNLVKEISKVALNKKIPLYVDPKYDWKIFGDVDIEAILPNMKEAASGIFDMKTKEDEILERDNKCKFKYEYEYSNLVEKYPVCKNFIIKAASKGAVILTHDPKDKIKVIEPLLVGDELNTDVGCGDVFDAFAIIGMLNKHTLEESVLFANFVAGLKAKKSLGEHISLDDIETELEKDSFSNYVSRNSKLMDEILKNFRTHRIQYQYQ
ncbi:hypothetical protein ASJ81_10180 [Methanosarcina spelaei]|uniref:Carbohydrate kinase PfkB domain-containing protein n=1 Tax=Methanosarcina spelaei TaxID=1036679 RepID=A0A2A2HQD8_9EURY|nr:PfkB family carbohydrate kinase [Methanosarcina spelaei]PAV11486.1 hypothetical protein ASJ81_10180 [Methanosarcina spelaei]